VEGSKKFSTNYEGVTYYFKSEKNKQLFLENPEKYLHHMEVGVLMLWEQNQKRCL
jgi:YHS domain-containing protein